MTEKERALLLADTEATLANAATLRAIVDALVTLVPPDAARVLRQALPTGDGALRTAMAAVRAEVAADAVGCWR